MIDLMLGYDYQLLAKGIKVPISAPIGHLMIVGGSGSGKSTSVLYYLHKLKKQNVQLSIVDFKASKEFVGITDQYAEFEDSFELIKSFYSEFVNTPEYDGVAPCKILIIDEIAGLLTHLGMTKEGKAKAEEIRGIMSSILMLGRSRNCFLWLSMQRFSTNIFPSSSGAVDNFHILIGLGRMNPQARMSLFAGEHFEGEEELLYGQGRGLILIDGRPLKAIAIPKLSKKKILKLLTNK